MSEAALSSRPLLSRAAATVIGDNDHGHKLLLGLGGAAIALSAISMAHLLATLILPTAHDLLARPRLMTGRRRTPASWTRPTPPCWNWSSLWRRALDRPGPAGPGPAGPVGPGGRALQSYRQLAPSQAQAINASIPFSSLPGPAARPFKIAPSDVANRTPALDCLTAAVYYEAASESDEGQAAVAQVVLNRVRHPLFPKTVCGVVFQVRAC